MRRFHGVENALQAANLEGEAELYGNLPEPSQSAGYAAITAVMERTNDFTAIVCPNDPVALGVIEALQEKGLRVPEDVSVTGFDGAGIGYGGSQTLTTAFFNRQLMGRRAVKMLGEIANSPEAPPRHELIPTRLLIRDSSSAPAKRFHAKLNYPGKPERAVATSNSRKGKVLV
jgi:LacI family transcriptional regulator